MEIYIFTYQPLVQTGFTDKVFPLLLLVNDFSSLVNKKLLHKVLN